MTNDWDKAAKDLKRDVGKHGGFLTIQKDDLRKRFGIGRLAENISDVLAGELLECRMYCVPHPFYAGTSLRVYDLESEIGKVAQAVADPQVVPETALSEAVDLYNRAEAGKNRRSVNVPWLSALEVFLQYVIGRPPEDWEDLKDDRERYQLLNDLVASLGLPDDIASSKETVRLAGAVYACRPHGLQWEDAQPGLGAALAEAARRQKEIFDRVLLEAAKYLLRGAEIPSSNVELGRLGLRYRREAQGGIGWTR